MMNAIVIEVSSGDGDVPRPPSPVGVPRDLVSGSLLFKIGFLVVSFTVTLLSGAASPFSVAIPPRCEPRRRKKVLLLQREGGKW